MDVDVNDVKIIISTSLQFLIRSCNQYAKNHPLVSTILLLFLILYIFLPSLFNIFFHTCPLVICTTIFLGKMCSKYPDVVDMLFRPDQGNNNNSTHNHHKFPFFNHGSIKLSRPSIIASMSRRTFRRGRTTDGETAAAKNDASVDDESVLRRMMIDDNDFENENHMKSLEEKKGAGYISNANGTLALHAGRGGCMQNRKIDNTELPRSDDSSVPCSYSKSNEDFVKLDAESSNGDAPQDGSQWKKLRCLLDWTEDDQKNLMDLGSSDTERSKRLEGLIARRKSRQKLRYYLEMGANVEQSKVRSSIVGERNVEKVEGQQPGSAPSVLLPAGGNPFDLPYEPLEEKPILTGGSFDEEFFYPLSKDSPYYKHDSFSYGSWLMGDINEDIVAKSSYLTKPKHLEAPRQSMFTSRSVAEDDFQQIPGKHCQEVTAQANHVESGVDVCPVPLPPKVNDQKKSDEVTPKDNKEPVTSHTEFSGGRAVGFDEDNPQEGTNAKIMETDNSISKTLVLASQDKSKTSLMPTDDEDDESSSSSSDASVTEDVVSTVKNEAFRNSVKRALTILGPRKCQNVVDDTTVTTDKEAHQSFYTSGSLNRRPASSLAFDLHEDLSDAESPRYDDDAESLVYDADVDKDANSGDEDLWAISPHPVQLKACGMRSTLHEPRDLFKSPLGGEHNMRFGYSLPPSKLREQRAADPESEDEESNVPMMDIDHRETTDENQEVIVGIEGDVSSVSSSSEWLDHRNETKPRYFMGNFKNSTVDVDSSRADEYRLCLSESNIKEPVKITRRVATASEALNLIDENLLLMAEHISQTPTFAADQRVDFHSTSPERVSAAEQVSTDSNAFVVDNISNPGVASTSTNPTLDLSSPHQYSTSLPTEVERRTANSDEYPHAHQSFQTPSLDLNPVSEDETTRLSDASLSPRSVLHETSSLDDIPSMNREDDAISDNHQSVQVIMGQSSSSEIPQPSFSQDVDTQQPRLSLLETAYHQVAESSELAFEEPPSVVLDSVSSPKSVLRMVASVDEIDAMTSEPNTLMEDAHQNDRATPVENESMNNPSQEAQQPTDHHQDGDLLRPIQSSSNSGSLGTPSGQEPAQDPGRSPTSTAEGTGITGYADDILHHHHTQYKEPEEQVYLATDSNQSENNGATQEQNISQGEIHGQNLCFLNKKSQGSKDVKEDEVNLDMRDDEPNNLVDRKPEDMG